MDDLKSIPGAICLIEDVPDVSTDEVSGEGTVQTLWEPSNPKIAQVGLIADDTDKIKFTSWRKSDLAYVQEGDTVRMRALKKNWYEGRCSLAVTYDSKIIFRSATGAGGKTRELTTFFFGECRTGPTPPPHPPLRARSRWSLCTQPRPEEHTQIFESGTENRLVFHTVRPRLRG